MKGATMNTDGQNEYSFELKRGDDYKSRYLYYKDKTHELKIYLEMSGSWKYDWVCVTTTSFSYWDIPKGQLIAEDKKNEIINRLKDWSTKNKIRIDIGPGMTLEEMIEEDKKRGWIVEKRPDGSIKLIPPPAKLFFRKLLNFFIK